METTMQPYEAGPQANSEMDKMVTDSEHRKSMEEFEFNNERYSENRYNDEVKYNWRDVTTEFIDACSELTMGELLHDANFGLFEGMSAIEMMDPKMDAGMICNQTKHKVLNFQQAIEAKTVKTSDFTHEELIGIIDETFACIVTWLEGHSLAQTVFINLYLHDPRQIKNQTLLAFSICALKLVDLIREKINRAGIFEEEDFQTMTYNFKMAGDETETRAISGMKDIEDELNRTIKSKRARAGVIRDDDMEHEYDLAVALNSRIKFTRLFYSTILALSKEKCQGVTDADKYLKQMREAIDSMKPSIALGIQPSDDPDAPRIMGFEPLVNQRLLPPTFPRYTRIKSRSDTMEYFDLMITRLLKICSVVTIGNLHEIIEFFLDFSKPSPCLLSRSLLQLLVLPQNRRLFGNQPIIEVLKETVRGFCAPPVLMPKCIMYNNYQAKEVVDAFLTQASRPLISILQIAGHNRARQRDKWGHLLDDFAVLQDEAEKVDSYFHTLMLKVDPNWQFRMCFGTWVLYLTLRVMICYTVAGLELELYSVHEYNYVFWYLCEVLFNWMMSTINRADNFVYDHDSFAAADKGGRNAKKNKKKKKPRTNSPEMILAQAMQNLTGGYYKAVIGLTMDNKLPLPKFDFDCEEVRFNHRFAPFGSVLTPPPMHYRQFKDMTDVSLYNPPLAPSDLYSGASKCFQQAKIHLESISTSSEEVQTLLKIAKTNLVVMRLLSGGHRKESKISPEFDFIQHKLYPVIKLP